MSTQKWKIYSYYWSGQKHKNMPFIGTLAGGLELIQLCIRCIEFSGWQTNKLHKYKWKCALTSTRPIGAVTIQPANKQSAHTTNNRPYICCRWEDFVQNVYIFKTRNCWQTTEQEAQEKVDGDRWSRLLLEAQIEIKTSSELSRLACLWVGCGQEHSTCQKKIIAK